MTTAAPDAVSADRDAGQTLVRRELVAPEPAAALAGLLGVRPPDEAEGLPLLWHWLYTLERPAQSDLGDDGHPVRGVLPAPPGPGRRRMWAGGRVRTHAPLRVGEVVTRTTRVVSETEKHGRSGAMTLVEVEHLLHQGDRLVVEERQDIVYPEAAAPGGSTPQQAAPASTPVEGWELPITPTLLFRFSALTYNGHRIHYDRDYATGVEGYPGLVTHGPLQAVAMAEAARRSGVRTASGAQLDYRLVSPLFDHQGLVASVAEGQDGRRDLAVHDLHGRQTATGSLRAVTCASDTSSAAR